MNVQKMGKIIIIITIIMFIIIIGFWIAVISTVSKEIHDNGGVKSSIIKIGKEVKDISQKIDENNPSK